jgi:hypothetical protein
MMAINCRAIFMPLRLHASFIPVPILGSVPLNITRIERSRRPACERMPSAPRIGPSSAMCRLAGCAPASRATIGPGVLVIEKCAIAQIFAITLDQVGRHRGSRYGAPSAQFVEARQTVGPSERLTAHREAPSFDRLGRSRIAWQGGALGKVPAFRLSASI